MMFQVGDIIYNSMYGLRFIVEVNPIDTSRLQEKLRGTLYYNVQDLISSSERIFGLRGDEPAKYRLATDEDIVNALSEHMHYFEIADKVDLKVYPEDKSIAIFGEDNSFIFLNATEIKVLKEFLKGINV